MTEQEILDYISVCRKDGMAAQKPLEGLNDDQLSFLVETWPEIPVMVLQFSSVTDCGLKTFLAKAKQLQSLTLNHNIHW